MNASRRGSRRRCWSDHDNTRTSSAWVVPVVNRRAPSLGHLISGPLEQGPMCRPRLLISAGTSCVGMVAWFIRSDRRRGEGTRWPDWGLVCLWSMASMEREQLQRSDKGDDHQKHAGYQRGDGDGNPDQLFTLAGDCD